MIKFIGRRLLQIVLLIYLLITAIFFVFQALPGDITQFYLSPDVPPEVRQAILQQLGLDQPLHIQYFRYLGNFLSGNFGEAFPTPNFDRRPVFDFIKERLPRTILLFLTAVVISYYMGFTLGKIIAWRRGRLIEYATTVTGVTLLTMFPPIYALFLIWMLAVNLSWFPVGHFSTPDVWREALRQGISSNQIFIYLILSGILLVSAWLVMTVLTRKLDRRLRPWVRALGGGALVLLLVGAWNRSGLGYLAVDILHHIALPVLTLATISFGASMLLTRDSMLETIREDYVLTARAKGLPDQIVRDRHVARNALLPVVTSFALAVAMVVDGGVITETIFSWPGMGLTLLAAIREQNWPVAIAAFTFVGIFVLLAHLIVDILYAYLDPRIRYE